MADVSQSPLAPSVHMSLAKVENVVKPPQNPVINSAFSLADSMFPFSSSPNSNPIMKHPTTLTMNVPNGKEP